MDPGNGKKDSIQFHPEKDHFNEHWQMGMVLINRDRRKFHECVLHKIGIL